MRNHLDYWHYCHGTSSPNAFEGEKLNKENRQNLYADLDVEIFNDVELFRSRNPSLRLAFLDEYLAANQSTTSFLNLLEKMVGEDCIKITSPFSDRSLYASCSLATQLVSFIRFYDEGEVFYLVQNHQSFAGFFFPKRSVYLSLAGGSAKGYVDFLIDVIINNNKSFLNRLRDDFAQVSLVVSCPRPWHYYYNSLMGFFLLDNKDKFKNFPVVSICGGDFFNLTKVHKNSVSRHSTLNKGKLYDIPEKCFFIIGVSFESLGRKEFDLLSETVIGSVSSENKTIPKKNNIKMWVGITGQKRSWLEQEEGIVKIINSLLSVSKNVEVVFDGWTTPLTPTKKDFIQIEADKVILNNILSNIDNEVIVKSVIGLSSAEKVQEAISCDFFVANHASGSLHVASLARLPGLSHLNNSMPKKHHVHFHTTQIDSSLVKDIAEPGKTGHHVSYSIPAESFNDEFKVFFNNLKVGDLKCLKMS